MVGVYGLGLQVVTQIYPKTDSKEEETSMWKVHAEARKIDNSRFEGFGHLLQQQDDVQMFQIQPKQISRMVWWQEQEQLPA